jgi:hypothetical protein
VSLVQCKLPKPIALLATIGKLDWCQKGISGRGQASRRQLPTKLLPTNRLKAVTYRRDDLQSYDQKAGYRASIIISDHFIRVEASV